MELYQLRAFVVVTEDMHMGRAAARLHLTQPTLSRQIGALERDLGVELFSRRRRRLELTAAGATFRADAVELLRLADDAKRTTQRVARGEAGALRLGFVQSARYEALPRLVGQFHAAVPAVRLDAAPMTTLEQLTALRGGELDAGLLRPQQPRNRRTATPLAGLRTRILSRDSMHVALPAGHPLARRRTVALADLSAEPFVLYPNEAGSTGHDLIIEYCLRAGFAPDIVQQATDAATVVALVAAGLGVSILISPLPPADPGQVIYAPLTDPLPTWELALAWSPDNDSPALQRFLALSRARRT